MKLLLLVIVGSLTCAGCMTKNMFRGMGESAPQKSPEEQQAAEELQNGAPEKAQVILEKKLGSEMVSTLASSDHGAILSAINNASDEAKQSTLPLMATTFAAKQKVEVINLLETVAANTDNASAGDTMARALPTDSAAAKEDLRKARDISTALVLSGSNTSDPVVTAAFAYTLAHFGNHTRELTGGSNTLKVDQAKAAAMDNAEIDDFYYDLQTMAALGGKMRSKNPQAGTLGDNAATKLENIDASVGADRYEKFRDYLTRP